MTHWKKEFNYLYAGAWDLQPKEERTLTIRLTQHEEVTSPLGEKQNCFVAYFEESSKPMILNKTNCKSIARLYGPDTEDWPGRQIIIKAETVKAFGEIVDALRVKNVKPQSKKSDCAAQGKLLRACSNIPELQKVYTSFTSAQKAGTLAIKDEMKIKLSKTPDV